MLVYQGFTGNYLGISYKYRFYFDATLTVYPEHKNLILFSNYGSLDQDELPF